MTYTMKVAGLERELPLCKVSDDLYIGAFIIFGDAELPAYRDISHLTGAAPRISKVPHTSELIQN